MYGKAVLVAVLGRTRTRGTRAFALWLGLVSLLLLAALRAAPQPVAEPVAVPVPSAAGR